MDIFEQRSEFIMKSFDSKKTWEEKYKHIIQWGKKLPPLNSDETKDEFLVRGCQSRVWVIPHLDKDKKVVFKGQSDALITQGLLALILYFYSEAYPQDVVKAFPDFIHKMDLIKHLSPLRRGGVGALIYHIQKETQKRVASV